MKYVITVIKVSGTRKVLETHEFKGTILEKNVINECYDIAKKARERYCGDLNVWLIRHGEYGDGTPSCRTIRDMFIPKGARL